jgi:Rad3-related DNA helicase
VVNELQHLLEVRGFAERPAQNRLFEHLIRADNTGVVSQAGTGTGKSMAVLAAAAHKARALGKQSIVITPTLTLMNQYRDGDTPWAAKAFDDLAFAELRGRAHYWCEMTKSGDEMMGEYLGGCGGSDAGCTKNGYLGHDDFCDKDENCGHGLGWVCEYQAAKILAMEADVVVTNADMLIVNDRILAPMEANFFDLDGALFVDEAHTLDQKFRDYASRSLHFKGLERFKFAGTAGPTAARWLKGQDGGKALTAREIPASAMAALRDIAAANIPDPRPKDGLAKQRETQEAVVRILAYADDPHDSAVLHINQQALKMDWINVSQSSGELLRARHFGLVSATVPKSMAATLGVADAPFADVGHPFDYGKQAWLGFSAYGGDYRSAQSPANFEARVNELVDLLKRSKGGALLLFSSFKDMEAVADRVIPQIRDVVGATLVQDREGDAADRQVLADKFRADGNAVLFGSESFATGFDVPGNALRLVVVWKLPYPAVDPVANAIRSASYQRYEDMMRVRAVQAIGRLIRTDSDKGIVWLADQRGKKLLDPTDPLTSHIPEFARL